MPVLPVGDRSWREYKFPPLTGGVTVTQAQDNECQQFENVELARDGYIYPRSPALIAHTAGALGSAMCVGLGYVGIGSASTCHLNLIVAKTGTTFYATVPAQYNEYNSLPPALATFTTFTVPTSPLDDPVYFEALPLITGDNVALMANINFTGVVSWDGSSGSATVISGSPANPSLICTFNSRLYVVGSGSRNTIYFSGLADPTSWPSTNNFGVNSRYGPVTGLVHQDDRLYIFTTNAVLYLVGDPGTAGAFYVGELHPNIGCKFPSTICQLGYATAFTFGFNAYLLSGGSINLISEPIRSRIPINDQTWATLAPFSYMLREANNTTPLATTPKVPTSDVTTTAANYDRERYGSWGQWTWPLASGLGASNPWQAVCKYISEWECIAMPGGDGNLYLQIFGDRIVGTGFPYLDSVNTPIVTAIQTRAIDMGQRLMTKQWREGMLFGTGTITSMTMTLVDVAGNSYSVVPVLTNSGNLPCQFTLPAVDGTAASAYNSFCTLSLSISGTSLNLQDMILVWRPVRFNLLTL